MKLRNKLYLAIHQAEKVIDVYEKAYPGDKRVRKGLEAAKNCYYKPSEENRLEAFKVFYDTSQAAIDASFINNKAAFAAFDVADAVNLASKGDK